MRYLNLSFLLISLVLFAVGCSDEESQPLVILETVEKGAYPRLIKETERFLDLYDVEGSVYTYDIEFVDEVGGSLVEEYQVDLFFKDNNPINGDQTVGPIEILTLEAVDFLDGENGYKQAPTISISGSEMLSISGLKEEDILTGDQFQFKSSITLEDGRTFNQENSSSTIVGPGFQGHFDFSIPAACSSNLEGKYRYLNIEAFCAKPQSGIRMIEIRALGDNRYSFNDWSLGVYSYCYTAFLPAGWGSLAFEYVCGEVSFIGFVDNYGDTWSFESEINGEEWTIEWSNTYGEYGKSVIYFPGGVPFTLAE